MRVSASELLPLCEEGNTAANLDELIFLLIKSA